MMPRRDFGVDALLLVHGSTDTQGRRCIRRLMEDHTSEVNSGATIYEHARWAPHNGWSKIWRMEAIRIHAEAFTPCFQREKLSDRTLLS